ncbi:MAG: hypothetical protein K5663_06615 [Clostridiales bacterium]|nr:hypothetical protein [Clostridiales bacterium]
MKQIGKIFLRIIQIILALVIIVVFINYLFIQFDVVKNYFTIDFYDAPKENHLYYMKNKDDYLLMTLTPEKLIVFDYIHTDERAEGMTRSVYDVTGSIYGTHIFKNYYLLGDSLFSISRTQYNTKPLKADLVIKDYFQYNYLGEPEEVGNTIHTLLYISDDYYINSNYTFYRVNFKELPSNVQRIISTIESEWDYNILTERKTDRNVSDSVVQETNYSDKNTELLYNIPDGWHYDNTEINNAWYTTVLCMNNNYTKKILISKADCWGSLSANERMRNRKSEINNSYFLRSSLKNELENELGTTISGSKTKKYNNKEYISAEIYNLNNQKIDLMCFIRVENANIYLFITNMTDNDTNYIDLESILKSVVYPS